MNRTDHYRRKRIYGLEKGKNVAYGSNIVAKDIAAGMAKDIAMQQIRTGKAELSPANVAAVGALTGTTGYLLLQEKKGNISRQEMQKDMMQGQAEFKRNSRRKKGNLEKGALGAAALAGTAWGIQNFGKKGGSSKGKTAAWMGTGAVLGAMVGAGTLESITSGVRETRDLARGRYKSTYGRSKAFTSAIGAGGAVGALAGSALKNKGLKGAGIGAGAAAGALALYTGTGAYKRNKEQAKLSLQRGKTTALTTPKRIQFYTRKTKVGKGRGRVAVQRIKNPNFGRPRRRR